MKGVKGRCSVNAHRMDGCRKMPTTSLAFLGHEVSFQFLFSCWVYCNLFMTLKYNRKCRPTQVCFFVGFYLADASVHQPKTPHGNRQDRREVHLNESV